MILLHGNGEDADYFVHQLDYFSRCFRVIAVETRGHGKSPRGMAPFTIRQFANDLYEFMQAHKILKAHILGFSDGGNIAMIFAMRHPEMVDRLVLNGANLQADGVKREFQVPIEQEYEEALLTADQDPEAKQKAELYGLMVNDPNIDVQELAGITARTLVIAGTDDMIEETHTRLIYENLPDAELSFVRGSHFIAAEEPDIFNRRVAEFLNAEKEYKQEDFPTPLERVQKTVWEHMLQTGVLMLDEPGSDDQKGKVTYIMEYDEYGRRSFRQVPLPDDRKTFIRWKEHLYTGSRNGRLQTYLAELCARNGEENAYISCDFGLGMMQEPAWFEKTMRLLDEKQRYYISGLPWESKRVYHRMDSRMREIASRLYDKGVYRGVCCFLNLEEKVTI